MCDNTAVRWSDYELAKRQQDSEFRTKIAAELAKHIDLYRDYGYSSEYLQGMERARLLVLFDKSLAEDHPPLEKQDRLF